MTHSARSTLLDRIGPGKRRVDARAKSKEWYSGKAVVCEATCVASNRYRVNGKSITHAHTFVEESSKYCTGVNR